MSFGRNPHVAKAEAAEQKAREARDPAAYEQAWREAARQWDRAAAREKSDKRRAEYSEKADAARVNADADAPSPDLEVEPPAADSGAPQADAKLLN
jgi:hypothetical protein